MELVPTTSLGPVCGVCDSKRGDRELVFLSCDKWKMMTMCPGDGWQGCHFLLGFL